MKTCGKPRRQEGTDMTETTGWKVTLVFSPFDPDHYQNRIVSHVFDTQPDDEQIKNRFGVVRFTKPWETACEPGAPLHPYLQEMKFRGKRP